MRENTRISSRAMSANTQKAQAAPIITMKNKNELNTGLQPARFSVTTSKHYPLFLFSDSMFGCLPSCFYSFTLDLT